jgi:hypothetical protein
MGDAMKTCPACGQVIPVAHIFDNARVKQRIYDYICRHPEGVTRRQVIDAVYGHDPDGGPLVMNVVSVHIQKMNDVLANHGLRIASSGGPYSVYRLGGI